MGRFRSLNGISELEIALSCLERKQALDAEDQSQLQFILKSLLPWTLPVEADGDRLFQCMVRAALLSSVMKHVVAKKLGEELGRLVAQQPGSLAPLFLDLGDNVSLLLSSLERVGASNPSLIQAKLGASMAELEVPGLRADTSCTVRVNAYSKLVSLVTLWCSAFRGLVDREGGSVPHVQHHSVWQRVLAGTGTLRTVARALQGMESPVVCVSELIQGYNALCVHRNLALIHAEEVLGGIFEWLSMVVTALHVTNQTLTEGHSVPAVANGTGTGDHSMGVMNGVNAPPAMDFSFSAELEEAVLQCITRVGPNAGIGQMDDSEAYNYGIQSRMQVTIIATAVLRVLDANVVPAILLSAPWSEEPVGEKNSTSNVNGRHVRKTGSPRPPRSPPSLSVDFYRAHLKALASFMLECLALCLKVVPSLCPNLAFLERLCINARSEHAVVECLRSAISGAPLFSELYTTWLHNSAAQSTMLELSSSGATQEELATKVPPILSMVHDFDTEDMELPLLLEDLQACFVEIQDDRNNSNSNSSQITCSLLFVEASTAALSVSSRQIGHSVSTSIMSSEHSIRSIMSLLDTIYSRMLSTRPPLEESLEHCVACLASMARVVLYLPQRLSCSAGFGSRWHSIISKVADCGSGGLYDSFPVLEDDENSRGPAWLATAVKRRDARRLRNFVISTAAHSSQGPVFKWLRDRPLRTADVCTRVDYIRCAIIHTEKSLTASVTEVRCREGEARNLVIPLLRMVEGINFMELRDLGLAMVAEFFRCARDAVRLAWMVLLHTHQHVAAALLEASGKMGTHCSPALRQLAEKGPASLSPPSALEVGMLMGDMVHWKRSVVTSGDGYESESDENLWFWVREVIVHVGPLANLVSDAATTVLTFLDSANPRIADDLLSLLCPCLSWTATLLATGARLGTSEATNTINPKMKLLSAALVVCRCNNGGDVTLHPTVHLLAIATMVEDSDQSLSKNTCRIRLEEDLKRALETMTSIRAAMFGVRTLATLVDSCVLCMPDTAVWALRVMIELWLPSKSEGEDSEVIRYHMVRDHLKGLHNRLEFMLSTERIACADAIFRPLLRWSDAKGEDACKIDDFMSILDGSNNLNGAEVIFKEFAPSLNPEIVIAMDVQSYLALRRFVPLNNDPSDRDKPLLAFLEPFVMHRILVSEHCFGAEKKELLRGGLLKCVKDYAKSFNIQVSDKYTERFMDKKCVSDTLGLLLWDLTGTPRDIERAKHALPVFCALADGSSWVVNTSSTRRRGPKGPPLSISSGALHQEDTNKREQTNPVSRVISERFLWLMSRIFQLEGMTYALKERALRVLGEVVDQFSVEDECLVKCLPKILFEIERSVSHPRAQIRREGVRLTRRVLSKLPNAEFMNHAPSLIIGLFPILEGGIDFVGVGAHPNREYKFLCPVGTEGSWPWHDLFCMNRDSQVEGVPNFVRKVCEMSYPDPLERLAVKHAVKEATELMLHCFDEKSIQDKQSTRESLCKLPFIPAHPSLTQVKRAHRKERKAVDMDTKDELRLLCNLLQHEGAHVRRAAMRRLSALCGEMRSEIYQIVSETAATAAADSIVGRLIDSLLSICASEDDEQTRLHCATCLGELGAIDPARVVALMPKRRAIQGGDKKHKADDVVNHLEELEKAPWDTDERRFALSLLKNFLVPALKETGRFNKSGELDRITYTVQEVVQTLGREECYLHEESMSERESQEDRVDMPLGLRKDLKERDLLGLVLPLYASKYEIKDRKVPQQPPFIEWAFREHQAWTTFINRYMIRCASGPFQPYLFAVSTAVYASKYSMNCRQLSHFLTPRLIADVISCPDHAKRKEATDAIVHEFTAVLTGARDSEGRLDASAGADAELSILFIFSVMDTLQAWSLQSDNDPAQGFDLDIIRHTFWTDTKTFVAKFLKELPYDLLGRAAMRINANARALRYFEMHARANHDEQHPPWPQPAPRQPRAASVEGRKLAAEASASASAGSSKKKRRTESSSSPKELANFRVPLDYSNHALPRLEEAELDQFLNIYSRLADPDAVDGIQVVRRINEVPSTALHRILELESAEDWHAALLEYDIELSRQQRLLDAPPLTVRSPNHQSPPASKRPRISTSATPPSSFLPRAAPSSPALVSESNAPAENMQLLAEIARLEKGRTKCLIEVGYLSAALDESTGVLNRSPELEEALLPLAVEASWRLQKWDRMDSLMGAEEGGGGSSSGERLTSTSDPGAAFKMAVGRLFLKMRAKDRAGFDQELIRAKLVSMSALRGVAKESYERSYPHLVRLHILQEVGSSYEMVCLADRELSGDGDGNGSKRGRGGVGVDSTSARLELLNKWGWRERLDAMSPSLRYRGMAMAVHRSLFAVSGLPSEVAASWIDLCQSMRHAGRHMGARVALRNAELWQISKEKSLIEECHLLHDSGMVNKALMILEPVELNVTALATMVKKEDSVPFLENHEKRAAFVERLMLATKWMAHSRQKHGQVIIERYKLVTDHLDMRSCSAYFGMARHYETMFHDLQRNLAASSSSTSSSSSSRGALWTYLISAVQEYAKTIDLDAGSLAAQASPRLLTLWFTFTETHAETSDNRAKETLKTLTKLMANLQERVMPEKWYPCLPQLVSRCQHPYPDTRNILKKLLIKMLCRFPQHTIWHVGPLEGSLHTSQQEFGKDVMREAKQRTEDEITRMRMDGKGDSNQHFVDAVNKKRLLDEAPKLFEGLVKLASKKPDSKKNSRQQVTRMRHLLPTPEARWILPTQAALQMVWPTPSRTGTNHTTRPFFPSDQMEIKKFHENCIVCTSKAKPKILTIVTHCRKELKFLCKEEQGGDFRKDARVMELSTVVNRLLQGDPEGRKRSLRMRTYSVICLNEQCGILEFIPHTTTMRRVINQAHQGIEPAKPIPHIPDYFQAYLAFQEKKWADLEGMAEEYRTLLLDWYRPYFHRWFLERFSDPTDWLAARITFTRSLAVWSAVGHVIGLGDRHTENMLLDVTSAEVCHVDFDCLFDKGLTLQRPEIVPFRLTPNLVDAMGVTGVEGCFRRTMEVSLKLMRDNKDTLLGTIEPFLRDLTVKWSSSSKGRKGFTKDHADVALHKVTGRLSGVYNLIHPSATKIRVEREKVGMQALRRGLGATQEEAAGVALSVQGQVQRLIIEATAEINLCQMYFGWTPWL